MTGGAGLVGSKLIEKLANEGLSVSSFDNLSGNSHPYISHPNIKYIRGDVRNYEELVRASAGSDTFFHLAASGNVIDSIKVLWRIWIITSSALSTHCAPHQKINSNSLFFHPRVGR